MVRRACLSGLDALDGFFSEDGKTGVDEDCLRDGDGDTGSEWFILVSAIGFFDEDRDRFGVRLARSGRGRSAYLTAGMVPSPIKPGSCFLCGILSGDPERDLGVLLPEEAAPFRRASSRERRRASRRSIRSLH